MPDKVTFPALPPSSSQIGSLGLMFAITIVCYFPPKLCKRNGHQFHLPCYYNVQRGTGSESEDLREMAQPQPRCRVRVIMIGRRKKNGARAAQSLLHPFKMLPVYLLIKELAQASLAVGIVGS